MGRSWTLQKARPGAAQPVAGGRRRARDRSPQGRGAHAPSSAGLAGWIPPLALGLVLGLGLLRALGPTPELHTRVLQGVSGLRRRGLGTPRGDWEGRRLPGRDPRGRGTEEGQGDVLPPSTSQGGWGLPSLDARSPLLAALRRVSWQLSADLHSLRRQRKEDQQHLQPLLNSTLKVLDAQRERLEAEQVTVVDPATFSRLQEHTSPNAFCRTMPFRSANLSALLPGMVQQGLAVPNKKLVAVCMELFKETEALEERHLAVMQVAQQHVYEMGRVDEMLKRMQWLDEHRKWWLDFREKARTDYSVNLLHHTMDGVRQIFWKIAAEERWTLTKFLQAYLPYAQQWETEWPQHQAMVDRVERLMHRMGGALQRYVALERRFKEAHARLQDHCGLQLPNQNWTAVHDQALMQAAQAVLLSGSAHGRCREQRALEEDLNRRPVMEAPKRMWQKDPELYSPGDKPRFSFLLQYRGRPEHVKDIVERLYACTQGMLGTGELAGGATSELYANMLEPYRTMWPWIQAWVRTDTGKFVVPVLPQLVPDNAGFNDLAFMARGDILIFITSDELPPESCSWLNHVYKAFSKWPHLGLLGFRTDNPLDPAFATPPLESKSAGIAAKWHAMEAALPDAAYRDPATGLAMHFTGMVNGGPLAMRRSVLQQLGGLDEVDDRQRAGAILSDLHLCSRVWLAGYQVARLEVKGAAKSPFFGSGGQPRPATQPGQDPAFYRAYDDFLVPYQDEISREVNRLNALLEHSPGG